MKYPLILSAMLVLGASQSASTAPTHAAHKKHTPKSTPVAINHPEPSTPGGFRDVPPDHWAARSVETLRRAGIVKGYPSGAK